MSYPYLDPQPFFTSLMMKNMKNGVCLTGCYYHLQYSPNSGVQWLLVMPWTFSIGQYAGYCTGALPWPSKWPAKWVHVFVIVLFAVALAAAGALRSE
jgi:hypothetical protein